MYINALIYMYFTKMSLSFQLVYKSIHFRLNS